jgi:glucose-1-phosphate cytidylyltransferase
MQVVILCGGLGTRLREETEYRPKPMVHIGGRPILWHIMKTYAAHGHKEFILCLGYKGEVIREFFLNYLAMTSDLTLRLGRAPAIEYHSAHAEEDWSVTLIETGLKTMTGGRLQRALPHVREDDFLLTYGDGLTDSDINASIAFHREHGRTATLTAIPPENRFGHLELAGTAVRSFQEKPRAQGEYVNGGYFVLHKRIGQYLTGDECVLEKEPLARLAAEGELHAFEHRGFWQCMDNYREYELLNRLWDSGAAPWKSWA